jgi:hypothetical protein
MNYCARFFAVFALGLAAATAHSAFVINEFDSDTPGSDADEFIELLGDPNEVASGCVVLYNGGTTNGFTPVVYRSFDLTGLVADANGYIIIGNPGVGNPDITYPTTTPLQNGEDAIALYSDAASAHPNGSNITTTNLIDHVIYRTNNTQTSANWSAFGGTPTIINEHQYGSVTLRSVARIPDRTGPFDAANPTPRAPNTQPQTITINPAVDFLRYNQYMAQSPTTLTVTLRVTGVPLNITNLELDASSDSAFSVVAGPDPGLPTTLGFNQATTMVIQLLDPSPTSNHILTGQVNYATDSATSPSGSIPVRAELVRVTNPGVVGSIVVNEVSYQPAADYNNDGQMTSQDDEFVELFNMTGDPINIEGWENKIIDSAGLVSNTFVFPAGAHHPSKWFCNDILARNSDWLPAEYHLYL